MSFPGQGGAINQRNVRGEDKKEILYIVDLTRIDTDGDGVVDKDFDILKNLEENKDYDMKIKFKDFDIGESKTESSRWLSKELGTWEFNTIINTSNISNDMKVVEINKAIDISEGNIKCKLKIDDIRISPVSAKVKMDIEGDTSDNTYFFLSVTDENGKDLMNLDSGISDTENTLYCDFELKGTEEKIVITPVVCIDGNEKHLDDEVIEIEIP